MSQFEEIGSQYSVLSMSLHGKLECCCYHKAIQPLIRHDTTVIDFACGAGFYSFRLLDWGASCVTGIDNAQAMIDAAEAALKTEYSHYASRANFVLGDGREPQLFKQPNGSQGFRLATASWFIEHGKDLQELTSMFRTVSINLEPDGVFFCLCLPPVQDFGSIIAKSKDTAAARRESGVETEYTSELEGGIGYNLLVHVYSQPAGPSSQSADEFTISGYHLKKSIYEEAARAGGMRGKLEWRSVDSSQESLDALGLSHENASWAKAQLDLVMSFLVVSKT
ncbi:hypothetical protein CDD82_7058 [Ophiocordyceps australis]|uniref:Methyltransferase domain-containing protein n=1 Tax=Ophiocordyceps australis TaxID=1399860 RepID=A0A2C5YU17_9HYPO|nr:hypothetical protein CDD82_7058 [Ophiocordyceps australis]